MHGILSHKSTEVQSHAAPKIVTGKNELPLKAVLHRNKNSYTFLELETQEVIEQVQKGFVAHYSTKKIASSQFRKSINKLAIMMKKSSKKYEDRSKYIELKDALHNFKCIECNTEFLLKLLERIPTHTNPPDKNFHIKISQELKNFSDLQDQVMNPSVKKSIITKVKKLFHSAGLTFLEMENGIRQLIKKEIQQEKKTGKRFDTDLYFLETLEVYFAFLHLQKEVHTYFGDNFAFMERQKIFNSEILHIIEYLMFFVFKLRIKNRHWQRYLKNRNNLFEDYTKKRPSKSKNLLNILNEIGKNNSPIDKRGEQTKEDIIRIIRTTCNIDFVSNTVKKQNNYPISEISRVQDELKKILKSFDYLEKCHDDLNSIAEDIKRKNEKAFKILLSYVRDGHEPGHKIYHAIKSATLIAKWRIGGNVIPVCMIHHFQEEDSHWVCKKFNSDQPLNEDLFRLIKTARFFERNEDNEYCYRMLSALNRFRFYFKLVESYTTNQFTVNSNYKLRCESLVHNAYEIMARSFDSFFIFLSSHIERLTNPPNEITQKYDDIKRAEYLTHQNYARRILKFFSPITHFINQRDMVVDSEDLPYKYLKGISLSGLTRNVPDEKTEKLNRILGHIKNILRHKRRLYSIKFEDLEITGRIKHRYSRSKKAYRTGDTRDELGIRIVVTDNKTPDCYNINDVIKSSKLLEIIPDQFDDYIKEPKPGGYQSLHQLYRYRPQDAGPDDEIFFEVQIRTREMDIAAGRGEASHWNYKLSTDIKELGSNYIEKAWLFRWADFFSKNVVAFKPMMTFNDRKMDARTPERKVVIMPLGSVPLDMFGLFIEEENGSINAEHSSKIIDEISQMVSFKNGKALDTCSYLIQNGDEITFRKTHISLPAVGEEQKVKALQEIKSASVLRWFGYVMSEPLRNEMCQYMQKKIPYTYKRELKKAGKLILDNILLDKRMSEKSFFFKSSPSTSRSEDNSKQNRTKQDLIKEEYDEMSPELQQRYGHEGLKTRHKIFTKVV